MVVSAPGCCSQSHIYGDRNLINASESETVLLQLEKPIEAHGTRYGGHRSGKPDHGVPPLVPSIGP